MENNKLNRQQVALEAMKIFMNNQAVSLISPLDKLKIWFGFGGWKQEVNYNFQDIAEKSFQMADAMLKAEEESQNSGV